MCRCMCECLRMLILERRGEESVVGESVVGEGKGRGKKGDVMRAEEGRGGHKR